MCQMDYRQFHDHHINPQTQRCVCGLSRFDLVVLRHRRIVFKISKHKLGRIRDEHIRRFRDAVLSAPDQCLVLLEK